MGGYMGISVPTTMNDIAEDVDDNVIRRGALSGERQPLLSRKPPAPSGGNPNIVVTAIIEDVAALTNHHQTLS